MPDNPTNWSADDAFWEDAWEDMNHQLDEHLPVSKKRRRPLLFWWLSRVGALALLLAIGFFGLQSSNVIKESSEQPTTNLELEEFAAISEAASPSGHGEFSATRETTSPSGPGKLSVNSGAQNSRLRQDATRSYNQVSDQLVQIPPSELKERTRIPGDSEPLKSVKNRPVKPARTRSIASMRSIIVATLPLVFDTTAFNPRTDLIGQLRPREASRLSLKKTSFFVEAIASHGTKSPGLGYGFGVILERKINPKHALDVSLGFRAQQQQFSFSAPVLAGDEAVTSSPIEMAIQQDSINATYDQFGRYLEGEARNYVSSYDARLGIGYTYSINSRWSVGLVGGINYLINGFAPSLLNVIQSSGEFTTGAQFRLVDNNGFGFAFDDLSQTIGSSVNAANQDSATEFTTHRLRADLGLTIGYQLGNRWGLKAGLRTFLQPVVSSEVLKLNPHRLHIGLRYQLR